MNQTPMTTREAIDEAMYCMVEQMSNGSTTEKGRDVIRSAMHLLCDTYGFKIDRYFPVDA